MPDVVQITEVAVDSRERQEEALRLMAARARFMEKQPGFVSIALHRSLDGKRIVNYVRWRNAELLRAAHHAPEFRKEWSRFGALAEAIDPHLYEVVGASRRDASQPARAGTGAQGGVDDGGADSGHSQTGVMALRRSRPDRRSPWKKQPPKENTRSRHG